MHIAMTFHLKWDRRKETLLQFKEKRARFIRHVQNMQAHGQLPFDEISWTVGWVQAPPSLPHPDQFIGENLHD